MIKQPFFLLGILGGVFLLSVSAMADPDYSLSGQVEARGDFAKDQNLADFSFAPDTSEDQLIARTRLGFELRPVDWLEGFVQGQFYAREDHTDTSQVNLYQAYVTLSVKELVSASVRIGRQDFSYGSTFFLGPNDFHDGLAWDAVKATLLPSEHFWIDAIGARYVQLGKNTSDDEPALYGAYSRATWAKDTDIDFYFFYHKGGFSFFHPDQPDGAQWVSVGTRLAGKIGPSVDYEVEPLFQFGRMDNLTRLGRDQIRAWGGHAELGYTFRSLVPVRVFAGAGYGSGEENALDETYEEFHGNIYHDSYLTGDTSLVPDLSGVTAGEFRASGVLLWVAGFSADIHPRLNVNIDTHFFMADETPEGLHRDLGNETSIIVTYKLRENVSVIASANWFFTGRFFEDAAGSSEDIRYIYIQTQIDF